jgi:lantibiotic biosynthesis dehydratase-like protein
MDTSRPGWQSYHLFYHDDLNTPLLKCVVPLVTELHRLGWAKKFFFIRYQLGGPHLRLRILPKLNCEEKTRELIHCEVARFLKQHASRNTKRETEIRNINKVLLANDPHEISDEVYPNNTLLEAAFVPETTRYGGLNLLPHSLDFFVISSVAAFLSLKQQSVSGRKIDLGFTARYLIRFALGFSESFEELDELVSYGMRWTSVNSPNLEVLIKKLYEQQRIKIARLVADELQAAANPSARTQAALWTNAAHSLAVKLTHLDDATRRHILESHLHMTANRFGLKNVDEFYLSGLLHQALEELAPLDRYLLSRTRSADGLGASVDHAMGLLSDRQVDAPAHKLLASSADKVYAGALKKKA